MYILDADWVDQYLDYHCGDGQTRIRVDRWMRIAAVEDMYIIRPRDLSMVYNYLREVGPVEVLRKVASRQKERLRNQKYFSAGAGIVTETRGDRFTAGDRVIFFATSHPACVDQIVVDDVMIMRSHLAAPAGDVEEVVYQDASNEMHLDWRPLSGWSAFSGAQPDLETVERGLQHIERAMLAPQVNVRRLPVTPRRAMERVATPSQRSGDMHATLFGLGNYAKTIVIPNLDKRIVVDVVHEVDPTQLGAVGSLPYAADTSPLLRDDENPDIVLIAGFHHTHADLAVQALERGAVAVVEKPLVTRHDQLDRLSRAMTQTGGRLFAGFHKRYSPFNQDIARDLALTHGDPVSCHCIVYEIPLPAKHWYEWPNSGSRIVSNGCHWIDHFLFLNNFSEVTRSAVETTRSGDYVVVIELANGASFSMALTDAGSARIGVQEHVEFRANGRTAHIVNAGRYFAESASRVLRRRSVHKYTSFRTMYREISARIVRGDAGDSVESTIASSRAMLDLEDILQSRSG